MRSATSSSRPSSAASSTHSYANRVGKGTHRALDRCQRWMRRYPLRACSAMCASSFRPSTTRILQRTLNRRIQDAAIRRLIAAILDSGDGVLTEEYEMVYFPGDDLFAANRPARAAHRQPDQPVLGQLLPERVRPLRHARAGLQGVSALCG